MTADDIEIPKAQTGTMYPLLAHLAARPWFPCSYLSGNYADCEAWRSDARKKVASLIRVAVQNNPRVNIVERTPCQGYVRETITLELHQGIAVPAYVLIPDSAKTPSPAIHLLHDHSALYVWGKEKVVEEDNEHTVLRAFKEGMYAGNSIGSELARRGFVVIVSDAPYWGGRRMLLPTDPPHWRNLSLMSAEEVKTCNQRAHTKVCDISAGFFMSGHAWMEVTLAEDLAVLDYLAKRSEVDARRIGVLGQSMGGFRAVHCAGIGGRYAAAVISGWMSSYVDMLRHTLHTFSPPMVLPGLYPLMDYPDVVSLMTPKPLLVINGKKDDLFTVDGVSAAWEKIERVYATTGGEGKFQGLWFDGPHELNRAMQQKAFDFLAEALG